MRTRTILASLVVTLITGAARAADLCGEALATAQPDAPPEDPLGALAQQVWSHVYSVYFATTGRSTELHVLAKDAKMASGAAFPPHAFICPTPGPDGSQAVPGVPKLFVTWGLVERAEQDKLYDVDFLALVIGHELGHRSSDFDWEGRLTTTRGSPAIEARADFRGAFFGAAAGYSTRRVACDAALDLFLNVEAGVSDAARAERKARLAEALEAFDVYESLYDAASASIFHDTHEATKLLKWIDEQLDQKAIPIPEFKILYANALVLDVVDNAPWLALAKAPDGRVPSAPCVPILAEHTAFWDQVLESAAAATQATDVRGTIEALQQAAKLLTAAEKEGASPLVTAGSLACVYAYLADTKAAQRELDRATKLVPQSAPAGLTQAFAANRAFIAWLQWLVAHPAPAAAGAAPERATWGQQLQAAAPTFAANGTLSAWFVAMRGYPMLTVSTSDPAAAITDASTPACDKSKASAGMSRIPPLPPIPRAGGCPCGWTELHFLADDATGAGPADGVRTCVPAGWAVGMRYLEIAIPLAAIPAQRLMSVDLRDGPIANLQTWRDHCRVLRFAGASDRGVRTYAGICPELGAKAVVIAADSCRVVRATVFPTP